MTAPRWLLRAVRKHGLELRTDADRAAEAKTTALRAELLAARRLNATLFDALDQRAASAERIRAMSAELLDVPAFLPRRPGEPADVMPARRAA